MKFSLIVATLNRRDEVEELFKSFEKQMYKNFEVIVVDQNDDNKVYDLYLKFKEKFEIIYIHINKKGLSLARNIGLKRVSGDVVCFPDDDCEYLDTTLLSVKDNFEKNKNVEIITYKSLDKKTKKESSAQWLNESAKITTQNIYRVAISYTIFIKYKEIKDVQFDEKLGVGAFFGSGEETDMLLELLHKNYLGEYIHNQYIFHPIKEEVKEKAYSYSLGYGAILRKEIRRGNKKFIKKAIKEILLKPLAHLIIEIGRFDTNNFKYHFLIFKGKIHGFISY